MSEVCFQCTKTTIFMNSHCLIEKVSVIRANRLAFSSSLFIVCRLNHLKDCSERSFENRFLKKSYYFSRLTHYHQKALHRHCEMMPHPFYLFVIHNPQWAEHLPRSICDSIRVDRSLVQHILGKFLSRHAKRISCQNPCSTTSNQVGIWRCPVKLKIRF